MNHPSTTSSTTANTQENILRESSGRVVISDFGFAREYGGAADVLSTSCGSPCYAAPELVLNKAVRHHNPPVHGAHTQGYRAQPADLWSCGVIFYALAFGHLPFESDLSLERDAATGTIRWSAANVYSLYRHIADHRVRLPAVPPQAPGARDAGPPGLSLLGRDLLLRLLEPDPGARITLPEVWRHAWFTSCVQ